jgi:hypothetical protein
MEFEEKVQKVDNRPSSIKNNRTMRTFGHIKKSVSRILEKQFHSSISEQITASVYLPRRPGIECSHE